MRLVGKVSTLREEANIRAWLRTVAVNVARSAARGGQGTPRAVSDEIDEVPQPATGAGDDHDEEICRMMERIARLPDQYREPLLLRATQGMRSRQISTLLDLPPATVDTRIARARRMLRDQAGDAGGASAHGRMRMIQ